ncbi:putative F-box protein At5g55150 [Rutidosis leptorrhynchoides]|uniref:putative F-box protein At5g55150 n=1 Tax=Rutidosis leptorrhynchoides TaxID=125765 RepID=UPI003A9977A5
MAQQVAQQLCRKVAKLHNIKFQKKAMRALFNSIDWSEMLPEILDMIAKKHKILYHEDYMSFAGVCKSWCSAAVRAANKDRYPNGLPSRFPCLLLLDKKQGYDRKRAYIVGLEDNNVLLVVIREGALDTTDYNWPYKTSNFKVFKFNLDSEEWTEVMDLGTKALFVGYGQSFLMEEDSRGVIKENCIYFSDDVSDLCGEGGGRDMGVYHMYSESVEQRFHGKSYSHFTIPIWIQPV